jgi:hypothetical protein
MLNNTPRVVMTQIDRYDWEHPQTVCYRTLPYTAPNHFTHTIKMIGGGTLSIREYQELRTAQEA